MLISLRHLQVEAGVSFHLLQHPTIPLPYLTPCWMTTIRSFCAEQNVSFRIRANRTIAISREGDQLLMEIAATLNFSKQEIIDLNYARTYLRASSVSDIATADGQELHPWTWRGHRIPDRHGSLNFARQEEPTPYQRGLWRKLLRALLADDRPSPLRLRTPLGAWIAPSSTTWGAYVCDDTLYRRDPTTQSGKRNIAVHFPRYLTLSDGSTRTIYYENPPDWYSATIHRIAVPSDISGTHVYTACHATVSYPLIPANDESPGSFPAWIAALPPAEKRMLSSLAYDNEDAEKLLLDFLMTECTLHVGTDGGKKEHAGSFSWILCSPDKTKVLSNYGPVDGWHRCQTSLRSEAATLASLTLFIDEFACWANCEI